MSLYVVPDIHGQLTMLEDALAGIERDGAGPEDEVIFLGDYVDRGPDSRGVLDLLARGLAEGRNWTCLLGNHDRMMRRYLQDGRVTDPQISAGLRWDHPRFGGSAMRSYGIDATAGLPAEELQRAFAAAVPQTHLDLLTGLADHAERGELLFVHAGIRPGRALADQTQDDLVWIRGDFLNHPGPHPWLVVHGHTAIPAPRHFGSHIDLDGGAGMGRALFPAVIEGNDCWLLTAEGRQILPRDPLAPGETAPWA